MRHTQFHYDPLQLILRILPTEQGLSRKHLRHNTPHSEHIHLIIIIRNRQQALRRPIPPRRHIIRQINPQNLASTQLLLLSLQISHRAEVNQLIFISHFHYLLRLEVPMYIALLMHAEHSLHQILHDFLDRILAEGNLLALLKDLSQVFSSELHDDVHF